MEPKTEAALGFIRFVAELLESPNDDFVNEFQGLQAEQALKPLDLGALGTVNAVAVTAVTLVQQELERRGEA